MSRTRLARMAMVAPGLLVVWSVVGCRGGEEPESAEAEAEPAETIQISLDPDEKPPTFEFPDSLRSKNESLNEFLDEFRGICERGEYERYRLAVSVQDEPIQEGRFENMWHAVEHVRIELIKRLPELEELPSPAYAVLAKVTLKEEYVKDEPQRYVTIISFQEEGKWVFAPSPDERIHRAMHATLRKMELERAGLSAETQPASTQPVAEADQ